MEIPGVPKFSLKMSLAEIVTGVHVRSITA